MTEQVAPEQTEHSLHIGFLDLDIEGQARGFPGVTIQDLVSVLTATQQAVLAVAADELQLPNSHRLTDQQRAALTLVITRPEPGSLWLILMFLVSSATSGIVGNGAWAILQRLLNVSNDIARGQDTNEHVARAVLPYLLKIIAVSARRNQAIEFRYEDPSGRKIEYKTSATGNARVREKAQRLDVPVDRNNPTEDEDPNRIQIFEDGRVLTINSEERALVIKFPYYIEPITCVYEPALESPIAARVHIHDHIVVFGTMRYVPPTPLSPIGVYIRIDGLQDSHGHAVLPESDPFPF